MSDTKNGKLAKEIAKKAQERRTDKQYEILLRWRDGQITGLECIRNVVELETMVFVEPEDFRPNNKGKK